MNLIRKYIIGGGVAKPRISELKDAPTNMSRTRQSSKKNKARKKRKLAKKTTSTQTSTTRTNPEAAYTMLESAQFTPLVEQMSQYQVPRIHEDKPLNHPINVRAAIARQQGWVEVPISAIDLDVNRQWESSIREDAAKYGSDATYIVDPNTGKIIPESTFNKLQTEAALANSSGEIADRNTEFEIQQAQNHRALRERDPQDLAKAVIIAGLATNPLTAPILGYATQAGELYEGYKNAYDDWQQGNYGQAITKGITTTALNAIPYSKWASWMKYAPKIGVPALFATVAADAGATGLDPSLQAPQIGDPSNFESTLTPQEQSMIMNKTNWDEISKNDAQRDAWIAKIEKELNAAGFTYTGEVEDDLYSPAVMISGNKYARENKPNDGNFWSTDLWKGIRGHLYGISPYVAWWLIKKIPYLKNIDAKYWPLIIGQTGATINDAYLAYNYFNNGSEDTPDGYDERLAYYYRQLIQAYIQLTKGLHNTYVLGSTFDQYQTYPKINNVGLPDGTQFQLPDTMHYRIERAKRKNENAPDTTAYDSITQAIGNLQIDPSLINGQ